MEDDGDGWLTIVIFLWLYCSFHIRDILCNNQGIFFFFGAGPHASQDQDESVSLVPDWYCHAILKNH